MVNQWEYSEKAHIWQLLKLEGDKGLKISSKVKYGAQATPFIYFQFRSVAQSCPTLCNPMDCSTADFPVHHQLPEPVQTHVHWIGDAIQPSHPVLSPSPPGFNLSQHQGFFYNESVTPIRWPKYWVSASASDLPTNTQDWSPLGWTGWTSLQSKETLKSLLQHHSSKTSILQCSAFFAVQLSHPYMNTGKTIALTFVWPLMAK